ncbi:recombinase family protein [Clostridium sp. BL-8]|uniref:recombinase family protein n=1 Tax=Clostridium sp. BL-8 TaxID=349938 RepID=UPI00098C7BD0|nr:recombinase family protein [Clostridium sp. BL-8]OOM79503.1 DNA-invertase hin [Clostridium sp. BL-8]
MKAGIYSRKSKFTEKGESIDNQINMCIQYAKSIGIDEYEIYEDEGFSGGNTNRPKFQKLMKDIKSKEFTHLICYRLDRISRNVGDFASTIEVLNKYDIAFISIKEQFDTSSAIGRAMLNISATFAQLERETIAERIQDNLRELSKTGRWLGGPPPLGYKSIEILNNNLNGKNRKKHILEVNPAESHIPKLVFELFMKYKSYQKVSRLLESKGILSRKGSLFSRNLVKQTINNPTYSIAGKKILNYFKMCGAEVFGYENINGINGVMAYNRRTEKGGFAPINKWIISVGEHPGIISSDTWLKCQMIADEIKESNTSNRKGTSQQALLSGLVICKECNSAMAPRQNLNGKYTYRYYSCNLRNSNANNCSNDSLNAYDAEDYVVTTLKSLTHEDIIKNYEELKKKNIIQINDQSELTYFTKEIESNKKCINNLVAKMIYLDNDPELLEPFKIELKKLTDRNKELNSLIDHLSSANRQIENTDESLDEILSILDNFKKFYDFVEEFEDKKRLIKSLVKYVVWDSKTRTLDIILIGSSKERPRQVLLPLSNSSRRNGSC